MGSQISLTVSIIMIVLFSIAIISFSIGFASDNNAAMSIADDTDISTLSSSSSSGLSTFKDESEDTYRSISETTVEPGSDVIRSSGSFTVTWSNAFQVFTNILNVGYKKIFGSGGGFGVFLTALLGIIGFIFALYIIKTWRGNP